MAKTGERILEERRRLRVEYGELFDTITGLLFRANPVGMSFENEIWMNYDPKPALSYRGLKSCRSTEDVLRLLHEEFVHWF